MNMYNFLNTIAFHKEAEAKLPGYQNVRENILITIYKTIPPISC